MNLVLIVYLAGVAGDLKGLMVGTTILSLVIWAIALIWGCQDHISEEDKKNINYMRGFLFVSLVSGLLVAALPNERTTTLMLAAYGVQEIVQLEEAQKVGSKSFKVLDSYLDKALEEMEGKAND